MAIYFELLWIIMNSLDISIHFYNHVQIEVTIIVYSKLKYIFQ